MPWFGSMARFGLGSMHCVFWLLAGCHKKSLGNRRRPTNTFRRVVLVGFAKNTQRDHTREHQSVADYLLLEVENTRQTRDWYQGVRRLAVVSCLERSRSTLVL